MGNEDVEDGATEGATAGRYAALATFETDYHYGGSSSTVVVYDLMSGRPVTGLGGESVGCDGYSCETAMDDLVINEQGFTAVHGVLRGACAEALCESILVSDSAGQRTVDTSTSSSAVPSLTDLALTDDTLTWKHSGTEETTQLH